MPLDKEERELFRLLRKAVSSSALTDSEKVFLHRHINRRQTEWDLPDKEVSDEVADNLERLYRQAVDTSSLTDPEKLFLYKIMIEEEEEEEEVEQSGQTDEDPYGEWVYWVVRARQGEMATGRSFVRSILAGMPAVIQCYFDVWAENDFLKHPYIGVEFLINAGQANSLEQLTGMDRTVAEDALRKLDNAMGQKGCRRVADGPHWYSHRYVIHEDNLSNLDTPPPNWGR